MKRSFVNYEKPLIVAMIKHMDSPESIIKEVEGAIHAGAEGFGFQCDNLARRYHNEEDLHRIFSAMGDKPIYATNYKLNQNAELSYNELASELLSLCDKGVTLIDVMGDIFCKTEDELTFDEEAVKRQRELVDQIHAKGCEVLMSSHVNKFLTEERVLEIALEHQKRGADVSKIVVHANTLEEQIEVMHITEAVSRRLDIKFLLLCGGECCTMHRRLGLLLGNCMSLCMLEAPEGITRTTQPLIHEQIMYRDQLNLI